MYIEDDDFEVVTPYRQWDERKHFVPTNEAIYDPDDPHPPDPPPPNTILEDESGCTYQAPSVSRCARINDPKQCYMTDGCWWDIEFEECYPVPTIMQHLHYIVCLFPIIYAICYFGYAEQKVQAVWAPYEMFHKVYLCSMFLAACAYLYVAFRVLRSDAYADVRERYVQPTYVLLVSAILTPITLALWADRDYSLYWVFISMFVTSLATVWLAYIHLGVASPQRRKDRMTVAAIYYILFHVILMDNFIWWWLLFSSQES